MERRLRPIGPSCFSEREFSLRIEKSLQLHGHRQIAEPCKYCLVCDYFSLAYNFFSIVASHRFGNFINFLIKKIPSHSVIVLFLCMVVCCVLS